MIVRLLIIFISLSIPLFSQSLGYNLSRIYGAYAGEYLKPFSAAFSTAFNSGTFHTASPGNEQFNLFASVKFMGSFIPNNDTRFSGVFTETVMYRFNNVSYPLKARITVNNVPTIFGSTAAGTANVEIGDTIRIAGVNYPITESWTEETVGGLVNSSVIPFFVPHFGLGTFAGTDLFLRWLPSFRIGEYGSVSFFGTGIRHNVSRYFEGFPFDVSIQFGYQGFFLSDSTSNEFLSLESILSGLQLSKEFSGFTVYSSLQFETSAINLDYTFNASSQRSQNIENYRVTYKPDTRADIRFLAGASYAIGSFILNGDINFAQYTGISFGCGYQF